MGELVVGEEGKLSQRRRIVQQTDSYGIINHLSEHVQQSENIACWSIVLPDRLDSQHNKTTRARILGISQRGNRRQINRTIYDISYNMGANRPILRATD